MDRDKAISIAKQYADKVRSNISVTDILLYGSYAKNIATEYSDIDIAVIVDEVTDDYLDVASLLWKLTREVDDTIEPVLLTEDDYQSGFLQTVQRTGIAV